MMRARFIGSLIRIFVVGAAGTITLEEYLNTSYEPDMDYVDGLLEERCVGTPPHSTVQSNTAYHLRRKQPWTKVLLTLRASVTATRIRVPDVTVTLANPGTDILCEAGFVVVEILSDDDRMTKV